MRPFLFFLLAAIAVPLAAATPASAQARFFSYDPADAATRTLTRGVTLQVERRPLAGMRLYRLFSTSSRGSAALEAGGPRAALAALPEAASETNLYRISPEGDGRALARALCPGSDDAWVVVGRVRLLRPLVMHAVGQWPDGQYRHCVRLAYEFRGEWAIPPRDGADGADNPASSLPR